MKKKKKKSTFNEIWDTAYKQGLKKGIYLSMQTLLKLYSEKKEIKNENR